MWISCTIFSFGIHIHITKSSKVYSVLCMKVVFKFKINVASIGLDNLYGSCLTMTGTYEPMTFSPTERERRLEKEMLYELNFRINVPNTLLTALQILEYCWFSFSEENPSLIASSYTLTMSGFCLNCYSHLIHARHFIWSSCGITLFDLL